MYVFLDTVNFLLLKIDEFEIKICHIRLIRIHNAQAETIFQFRRKMGILEGGDLIFCDN